jgi:hypothetical protein
MADTSDPAEASQTDSDAAALLLERQESEE